MAINAYQNHADSFSIRIAVYPCTIIGRLMHQKSCQRTILMHKRLIFHFPNKGEF